LVLFDVGDRPFQSIRNMVQRSYHSGTTGLANVGQTNRVIRTKPAHALFHAKFFHELLLLFEQ
jgi:hypothetical protein